MFLIPHFQGIAPRFADRLLDDAQASFVANLKATNGNLRGFRSLDRIANFSGGTVHRSIKFYYPGSEDYEWFISGDLNADAIENPLANDAFNRIYFTEAPYDELQVTTLGNLETGVPAVAAGVPRPTTAPGVTAPVSAPNEPRAYVYTYVNAYGSEGAPSPPTIFTGNQTSTWTITHPGSIPAGVTKVNVYRSASGEESSGQYYLVGFMTAPTTTFNDSMAGNLVPLQPPLVSYDHDQPPVGLRGLVQHSSGALVGFNLRTVYFSVPYLPHAWPQAWAYTVEHEIVGIAAILNYIVVLTKGHPFILSGNHPSLMGIIRLPDPEPCTSKRSIVVMNNAVYFASPNGLCSIGGGGLTRPTNPLMTKDEFTPYSPNAIFAAVYGAFYIAFYEESRGFAISLPPYEPTQFVPLDRYSGVTGLDADLRTGDLIVTCTDSAFLFDAVQDMRFATTFRSKEYIATKPINLGAVQILFKPIEIEEDTARLIAAAQDYNDVRFAEGPLDTLNAYPINRAIPTAAVADGILGGLPPLQPLGGEPLYQTISIGGTQNVNFTLIADGVVRFTKIIADEKTHKMPAGYKATRFYVEVSGSVEVERVLVAETARECANA